MQQLVPLVACQQGTILRSPPRLSESLQLMRKQLVDARTLDHATGDHGAIGEPVNDALAE
jgi:hypothetical protein